MTRTAVPDPLAVPANESGVVRVFDLDLPQAEIAAMKEGPIDGMTDPAAQLLGLRQLRRDGIEIFPVTDLAGLGLPGYLSQGGGIPEAALAADAERLTAISGHVMIVYSRAFDGDAATLKPDPRLTLVGAYAEPRDSGIPEKMKSEAAEPYSGTPNHPPRPAQPPTGPNLRAGTLAITALALLVALSLFLLLF